MNKRHALLIALVLGVAAVLGAHAALRTTHLGAASRNATAAQLARREHRLNADEATLKRALTDRHAPTASLTKRPQKVVYVRPAPIVIHKHRSGEHNDDGGDSGGESGD
jgi:DMSO/TMAO reductase YedYZ molybdopterin-dependent catalytic subunit